MFYKAEITRQNTYTLLIPMKDFHIVTEDGDILAVLVFELIGVENEKSYMP